MLWPEWMVRLPVTRSRAAESSAKLQVLTREMRRVSPPTYSRPPPVIFWKCPPELQMILICSPGSCHVSVMLNVVMIRAMVNAVMTNAVMMTVMLNLVMLNACSCVARSRWGSRS